MKNLTEAREKANSSQWKYCVLFMPHSILGCTDDCSSCVVMATLFSKLHDTVNTIMSCQKGKYVILLGTVTMVI